jgi:hypothetical protein
MFYVRARSRAASLSHAMCVIARLRTVTKILQVMNDARAATRKKQKSPHVEGFSFFLALRLL